MKQNKKGLLLLLFFALGLVCVFGVVLWFRAREQQPAAQPKADGPAVAKPQEKLQPKPADAAKPAPAPLPVEIAKAPPRPAELAAVDQIKGGLSKKLTRPGSAGRLFFTADELTYSIQRDYDQSAAVEVENRSTAPLSIIAELIGLDCGLLGDFVGPGSTGRPLIIAPGEKAVLAMHLFAQDATQPSYHPRIEIKDAKGGEAQAWAPVHIMVQIPVFKLAVRLGKPDPGTLALPLTLTNEGGAISDLAVLAGKTLEGKVAFQPSVNHANLGSGGTLNFEVRPLLSTAFTKLEGEIVLSGAGQQQTVPVQFALPPDKKVFVATSFSTGSSSAADWICPNRPNVDTPVGGFIGGPVDPWSSNNPYLPQGDVTWSWLRIGPIELKTTFGKSPLGPFNPGSSGHTGVKLPPLGLGGSGDPQHGVDPQAASPNAQGTTGSASGSQFRGGDVPHAATGTGGSTLNGPRGLAVRGAYLHHRQHIFADNGPESMIAIAAGEPGQRVMVEAWHSQRWCGDKGRQILLASGTATANVP